MYKLVAAIFVALVLTACRDEARETELEKKISHLEKEVVTLNTQLGDVRAKLDDSAAKMLELKSAVGEMGGAIQRFAFDDWKKIASQLESLMTDVDTAAGKVEISVEDIKKAAIQMSK